MPIFQFSLVSGLILRDRPWGRELLTIWENSFLPVVIIVLWVAGVAVKNLPTLSMAWFSASEKCEQWSWLWWSTSVMSALCMYRQHQEFEGSLHYIWMPARATGLQGYCKTRPGAYKYLVQMLDLCLHREKRLCGEEEHILSSTWVGAEYMVAALTTPLYK